MVPICVRPPNLPLNCWSEDSSSRIGSLIGVPLYADECTSKSLRVSFARILVEMDVTKEIKKIVKIVDPNGKVISQPVVYDWLPPFYKKCNVIGHNCAQKLLRKFSLNLLN